MPSSRLHVTLTATAVAVLALLPLTPANAKPVDQPVWKAKYQKALDNVDMVPDRKAVRVTMTMNGTRTLTAVRNPDGSNTITLKPLSADGQASDVPRKVRCTTATTCYIKEGTQPWNKITEPRAADSLWNVAVVNQEQTWLPIPLTGLKPEWTTDITGGTYTVTGTKSEPFTLKLVYHTPNTYTYLIDVPKPQNGDPATITITRKHVTPAIVTKP